MSKQRMKTGLDHIIKNMSGKRVFYNDLICQIASAKLTYDGDEEPLENIPEHSSICIYPIVWSASSSA
jgi:hypothetical protein